MNKKLDNVFIAAPCPMQWEEMVGDHRIRLCGGCSRHVYNLSDMTSAEAEQFLAESGESQCLRFFRRSDGKIMTDNCPRGIRAVRNRLRTSVKVAAAVLTSVFSFLPSFRSQSVLAEDVKGFAASTKNCKKQRAEYRGFAPPPIETDPVQPPTLPVSGGSPQHPEKGNPPAKGPLEPAKPPASGSGSGDAKNSALHSGANAQKDLKDSRAYNLFVLAGKSERVGKLMLAQTHYMDALKIARSQTAPADPKLIMMIEESLAGLKQRLKAPGADSKRP